MTTDFGFSTPVPVTAADRAEYLSAARQFAAMAGASVLPFFRTALPADNKSRSNAFDPVTQADRTAEQLLREQITARFPDHGILGEEFGHQPGNGLTWVIDPIDGTRAFITGMVHWGVLLALFDGAGPILGVMCQPFVDELFWGDGDHACYQRGSQAPISLTTATTQTLAQAKLTTTGHEFYKDPAEHARFQRLCDQALLVRTGGDCYIYAMLAAGHLDIATDAGLKPYDIQALIPIIEGAGGVVTTADGGSAALGGWVVASANATLHAQVLAEINRDATTGKT